MGEAAAHRLMGPLGEGPEKVFGLIKRHGIECESVQNGTLHCAHSPAGFREIETRFRQGNRMGAPLELLDAAEARSRVGSARIHGALLDRRAGTIQPLAYARGLARAAAAAGAEIHELSAVSNLFRQNNGWLLKSNGHPVRARTVLIATNAYHLGIKSPFRPRFVPVAFSQYATSPLDDVARADILPGGEGCWDTAQVMNSFRVDEAGRLIVGAIGSREALTGGFHNAHARRLLRRLFPALDGAEFEYAWHGTIAMTSDHVPKIVAFGPNALACFGYSGRGIGPGTVFGAAAAKALVGAGENVLPVEPVEHYSERFTGARAVFYELGAAFAHAFGLGLRGKADVPPKS